MPSRTLNVINELGLHARAAAKVVTLVQGFDATVNLCMDDSTVDASSIMGLLMLAASNGSSLEAIAEGNDADAALDALDALFANRFGEDS